MARTRQVHGEGGAVLRGRRDSERAAMRLDDFVGNKQPKPKAGVVACLV